ncbi:insulin-like growth factor-binding protein 1 [Suricata suricatta]|uniref:Insulin-like growth factor-binding protein 1 n=1 Tax=Suricata suricatta TaxID=37032 RepID=A0A673SY36_SURSU|nr:insulin-like growth factor-binding protein 1 [Suricata suricatta]XP_029786689.1 insulin-like growth factor-binding protein 1 [Suricata suricatta]
MRAVPAACAWLLLLLLAVRLGGTAPAPQPWRCAPCSPEKLQLCPPVPASCTESARPTNCGCCPMCTLSQGTACGVASARCASGLSCRVLPGKERPLQALIRGQGVCVPTGSDTDVMSSSESTDMTQEELLENFHLMAPSTDDTPILWKAIGNYVNAEKLVDASKGPCYQHLHEVLDRLAEEQRTSGQPYRFYLPNCSKNGFYHSKQCETSMDGEPGLCWCVYPWSKDKIPGSVEVRGDPNCSQYFSR